MPSGVLTHFDTDRGFGFLARRPRDCFVHAMAFEKAGLRPVLGRRYYYETEEGREGRERATDLELVPEYEEV